jgi:septation ring formation regulator EzrA
MASNITSETIDATYPVAGVDNDTQGFRDNFQIMKDNFSAAKNEIEDLQNKVLLKSQLSQVEGELDNNMAGVRLIDAQLDQVTEQFTALGTVNSGQNLSYLNGHYQTLTIAEDLTLTLADWPDSERFAKITVEIVKDGTDRTVTFVGESNAVFKKIASDWDSSSSTSIEKIINSDDSFIFEFWTHDGGTTVYASYKGAFS